MSFALNAFFYPHSSTSKTKKNPPCSHENRISRVFDPWMWNRFYWPYLFLKKMDYSNLIKTPLLPTAIGAEISSSSIESGAIT